VGLGGADVAVGGDCVDVGGHQDGHATYAEIAAFKETVLAVVVHLNRIFSGY